MPDADQLALSVAFFHLAVDQACSHLPSAYDAPLTSLLPPCPKMSRESIEVEIESITGEERKAARSQELSEGMDDPMCHVLGAGTELKGRKNLGAGIDGQPEPEYLFGTAEAGAQFIQLEVREVEMEEEALVQSVRVYTCTSEKGW